MSSQSGCLQYVSQLGCAQKADVAAKEAQLADMDKPLAVGPPDWSGRGVKWGPVQDVKQVRMHLAPALLL